MTTILHIASSSNLTGSATRQIGAVTVEGLKKAHPNATIIERDLIKNPAPHVSPEFLGAMFSGKTDAPVLALSEELVGEVMASDIIVIEAPMYNFGIPQRSRHGSIMLCVQERPLNEALAKAEARSHALTDLAA